MILRVGLTGGLASGKSTVSRMFGDLGCIVIDADDIVHDLYRPDEKGHAAIVREYGTSILTPEGAIDRTKLAAIAMRDSKSSAVLNRLIHPLVIQREEKILRVLEADAGENDRIAIVEATLLLESAGRGRYDRIIVVDASPEDQLERAVGRGMAADDARLRMKRQLERAERRASADYIIENHGSRDETHRQVEAISHRLRADLERMKQTQ